MPELKPCPFCGKQAKTVVYALEYGIMVKIFCSGTCCVAQMDRVQDNCTFDEIARAMENITNSWNRRAR